MFKQILVFAGTVIFIEWAIELLRFCFNSLIFNTWKFEWLSHSNKYVSSIINIIESAAVVGLLYLGYSIIFIIISVFWLSMVTKTLADFFIHD